MFKRSFFDKAPSVEAREAHRYLNYRLGQDCPILIMQRLEVFPEGVKANHEWSIKKIIDLSHTAKVDELLKRDEYLYEDIIEIDHMYSSDEDSI